MFSILEELVTGIILDLIVAVIVIMLLLFGIWRGAYKLIFGLISSLLAIVLTVLLVSSATQLVVANTTIDDRIQTSIDSGIRAKIPNANVTIRLYDLDGDGEKTELGYEVDGEVKAFDTLLKGTPYSIFSGTAENMIKGSIEGDEEVVFATVLVATLVGYIMLAITFIVLLIIFEIVTKAIMHILKKFITKTYFGHFVDKLLGAVLGLAVAAIFIFGALAIIKFLGTYAFIIQANKLIEESTVTKWLFNNNYLYNLLVSSFNVKGIIDSILTKITTLTNK
jgi:uncharacterized membrane protein required for colicin V production